MTETAATILHFWFGEGDDPHDAPADRRGIWFARSDATDLTIRGRFAGIHERARRGELDSWAQSPRDRLALVIVLDQFPRNMFRGTPGAFAGDPAACTLSLEGVERAHDLALRPVERPFLYMPLMHAEDRALQARCVDLFTKLASEVPAGHRAPFDNYLDFANKHRAIVDRFARFPHRNAILGRASTAEEQAFLSEPGSSF